MGSDGPAAPLVGFAVVPGPIDVDAQRAATPGCAVVDHLNNAGAALPTRATVDSVIAHLRLEAEHGAYEAAALATQRLMAVRRSAARLLGAANDQIVLAGSDTQAWTKALWGFALGGGIERGHVLLADRLAYDSHYLGLLQVCELTGARVVVVESTEVGTIDLGALGEHLAADRCALVAVTHVGTHRGLVNPVREVGAACRAAGIPLFLDACQSAGQLPVRVGAIGCQVATFTGRKWLRGPRGTGLLYVDTAFAERLRPIGIGGGAAVWEDADRYRLRPGAQRLTEFEAPIAAQLGLGVAIDHALALGIDAICARVGHLAEHLRAMLAVIEGVEVHDGGVQRSGIVTFSVSGVPATNAALAASAIGINVSVSEAPSARLDMVGRFPTAVIRASPHYYNTEDELERLVELVSRLAGR